ncbi:MAG: M61 family metallopeptidase [Phycisphaeraceae bacterium]|nr:M61 family metallopeptidase [Phycisphaeraceae bacterium]
MMTHLLSVLCLLSLLCAALAQGARAPVSPASIEYEISLRDSSRQIVHVALTLRGWQGPDLEVHMPVWRPGRYEVLDLAGGVRRLIATDAQTGETLEADKFAKSSWRIATRGATSVRVEYAVYCNGLMNRTRHADDTHAFLSGAGVFLFVDSLRHAPLRVRLIDAPPHWRVATGLASVGGDPMLLEAPDYDTLVDSPIEVGELDVRTFSVDGVAYEVALWGRTEAVPASFVDDLARISRVQHDLFGGFPYDRYVYITHVAPGLRGGTEHLNSTIIQTTPTGYSDPAGYRNILALASHELFHTWNVKQFRPKGLKPYDYMRENYTELLWIAEGTTSYYDELLCARAGVWQVRHYLESLQKVINAERARPGGSVQSVAEASFDAWVKFNRPTPDGVNTTVSFYTKGALVSLVLDASIRETSGHTKSLDDLMRVLNQRYPLEGPGYTTADVLEILRELTSNDYTDFFRRYVRGTEPLPFESALAVLGLELAPSGGDGEAYLGIDTRDADGGAAVSAVREDGPGFAAGLLADDVIVAIDGQRVRAADFAARTKKLKPGQQIRLAFFRRDALRDVTLTVLERPVRDLTLRRVKNPSPAQRAAYESWIGQRWPGAATDGPGADENDTTTPGE